MATTKSSETNDLLIALGHPLRRRILRALAGSKARSPRELAERLDQPLSNLSYHVRVLADCGAVKLVQTKQVRGSTQHFYRPSIDARWARSVLKKDQPKPAKTRKKKS